MEIVQNVLGFLFPIRKLDRLVMYELNFGSSLESTRSGLFISESEKLVFICLFFHALPGGVGGRLAVLWHASVAQRCKRLANIGSNSNMSK